MAAKRASTGAVLAHALRNRALRRLAFVLGGFLVAEFGSWIAVTTIAHGFGGVDEAAIVLVVQLAPAAIVATMVGSFAARWGERNVLCAGLVVQAVALAALAVTTGVPHPQRLAIYAAAVVASVSVVTTRPMVSSLLPAAVADPQELAAGNVVFGWLDGVAMLVGPLVAAVSIQFVDAWLAFAVFAALIAVGALLASRVPVDEVVVVAEDERVALTEAFATVRRDRGVRSVLLALAASSFAIGSLDLLYVVVAVDVLGGREADASWLNSAYGIGVIGGSLVALMIVGRRATWPWVVGGGGALALALTSLGLADTRAGAAVLLCLCGVAAAVLIVAARTLLQRATDLRMLCHVFALAEASTITTLLFGAAAVPAFVALFSARWAAAGVAVCTFVAVVSGARAMAGADRAAAAWIERIPALRATELFALLPAPALETVARQAEACRFGAGAVVIRQGDDGDCFYVVTAGTARVVLDGVEVATKGPGEGFGELALIEDCPRTATVVAVDDLDLLRVDRAVFLIAVTGHAPTLRHASENVVTRYVR